MTTLAPKAPEVAARPQQRGATLIELMIAMAIGLVIVLAASTAFLAGKKLFNTDADVQEVQESLRFTRHVVQGLLRQAGYADYAPDHQTDGVGVIAGNATLLAGSESPFDLHVVGASNTTVGKTGSSFGQNDTDEKARNDSLLVRFFGRSNANGDGKEDGTMVDCLGIAHAGPANAPSADDRVWSFFFVALAEDGEPELFCKYHSDKSDKDEFQSQPLARGVEKFNVVYGYDGDGDSVPDTWLEAREIAGKAASGGSANDEWRKVVAVRVGVVARSIRPNGDLKKVDGEDYRLFPLGAEFENIYFDPPDDGRFRSVATFTVMLRNVARDPA